jgi:hypothetical protein
MIELTAARVRELLHYDPETGLFTRLDSGELAGGDNGQGHLRIRVDGRKYFAHRLAWLYVHGAWPMEQIDHINGVRKDNRIANLRDVPPKVNNENWRKATRRSKTGFLGVTVTAPLYGEPAYVATIKVGGRRMIVGRFKTAADAHAAYVDAKRSQHEGCTL